MDGFLSYRPLSDHHHHLGLPVPGDGDGPADVVLHQGLDDAPVGEDGVCLHSEAAAVGLHHAHEGEHPPQHRKMMGLAQLRPAEDVFLRAPEDAPHPPQPEEEDRQEQDADDAQHHRPDLRHRHRAEPEDQHEHGIGGRQHDQLDADMGHLQGIPKPGTYFGQFVGFHGYLSFLGDLTVSSVIAMKETTHP